MTLPETIVHICRKPNRRIQLYWGFCLDKTLHIMSHVRLLDTKGYTSAVSYLFQCVFEFRYKDGNMMGKIFAALSLIKLIIYSLFQ